MTAAASVPGIARPDVPTLSRDLIAACLFALSIVFVPWDVIRGAQFADIANYAARMQAIADHGPHYFAWKDTIAGWISFEYFWFRLLVLAVQLGMEPETFIQVVAIVCSILTYRFMAARIGPWIPFIILTNPISIDLLSSQSRSALAFALFLTIVDMLPSWRHVHWRFACLAALPFIHTLSIAVIGIYAGSLFLAGTRRLSPLIKASLVVVAALSFVALVVAVLPSLIEATGDRRDLNGYQTKTLFYLTFWFALAGAIFLSYGPEACARWEFLFALFVVTSAPLIEALGKPGFRFVALSIPLIWIAVTYARQPLRTPLVWACGLYWLLLVYYWVR